MNQKQKIGLFGGSFDPVHSAHVALAHQALKQFELDHLFWIPASVSPFKKQSDVLASPQDRFKMIQLVCADEPRFEVSDYEINKGGVSYSIETLQYFEQLFKSAQFFWILGSDALVEVPRWKDSDQLMERLIFLVAGRGKVSMNTPKALKFETLNLDWNPISSTQIKAELALGCAWDQLHPRVAEYIRGHQLFGVSA